MRVGCCQLCEVISAGRHAALSHDPCTAAREAPEDSRRTAGGWQLGFGCKGQKGLSPGSLTTFKSAGR